MDIPHSILAQIKWNSEKGKCLIEKKALNHMRPSGLLNFPKYFIN